VIHTVGPVWRGGNHGESDLLASCYRKSLELATKHRLAMIAFPGISTGVYGYPVGAAARIAVDVVRDYLQKNDLPEKVVFCTFNAAATTAVESALDHGVAMKEGFMSANEAAEVRQKNDLARHHINSDAFAADRVSRLSRTPFGIELATAVAEKLHDGHRLAYRHRDYCGHGLAYRDSEFIVATVMDGDFDVTLMAWDSESAFIEFLAAQSDYSMSGAKDSVAFLYAVETFLHANQTITAARLLNFVGVK